MSSSSRTDPVKDSSLINQPRYQGVRKMENKWGAEIRVPGAGEETIWLGYHDTEEMAARAYDVAALALNKDCNFPDSLYILPISISTQPEEIQRTAEEAISTLRSIPRSDEAELLCPLSDLMWGDNEVFSSEEALLTDMACGVSLPPPNFVEDNEQDSLEIGSDHVKDSSLIRQQPLYKGVQKLKKKWGAEIRAGATTISLGCHDTPEMAARAYDVAALALNKECNFPDSLHILPIPISSQPEEIQRTAKEAIATLLSTTRTGEAELFCPPSNTLTTQPSNNLSEGDNDVDSKSILLVPTSSHPEEIQRTEKEAISSTRTDEAELLCPPSNNLNDMMWGDNEVFSSEEALLTDMAYGLLLPPPNFVQDDEQDYIEIGSLWNFDT